MDKLSVKSGFLVIVCCLNAACTMDTSKSDISAKEAVEEKVTPQSPTKTVSSRMAYIDPETGELISTPSSTDGISETQSAEVDLPPVKVTEYADGTVGVELNGRFSTPLVATMSPDGTITQEHSEEGHVDSESDNAEAE